MNILYISVHVELELDEISLFEKLGHRVYTVGYFSQPHAAMPGDELSLAESMPSLNRDEQFQRVFRNSGCVAAYPNQACNTVLTEAFVDLFDLVLVMHDADFIASHWPILSRRPVVWRTIGQNLYGFETVARDLRSRGLKIVRYSPMEIMAPHFAGQDAVIRFYKKPHVFHPWQGTTQKVLQYTRAFQYRYPLEYGLFRVSLLGIPYAIGGRANESEPSALGEVSHEAQLATYRDYYLYFYCCAFTIPYNLAFIEAWMAGMPMVVYNDVNFRSNIGFEFYEVPRLIENGVDGYLVTSPAEARVVIPRLMSDYGLARSIGSRGRERAAEIFSEEVAMRNWSRFLIEAVR